MAKTYWAFISYSSKDARQGQWLHKRLENYPIPEEFRGTELFDGGILGRNLRPIFRDRDELSGSANLGQAIGDALKTSRFLIVLCSPNSAQSEWVNKEIEEFRALGKGDRILALILDGEPNATSQGHPDRECFPPALRYPAEPIAGDLRREGDGRDRGFLKILAGITQLDFDQLYRRHERNLARRRFFIAVAATLLILSFAGLSAFAFVQRGIARTNEVKARENERKEILARQDAESAEALAEIRRLQAEENERKEKAARQEADANWELAEERLVEVTYQKEQTVLQRNEALRQEAIAERKFRDVLFGKYETAKAEGAREEALAWLAEVFHLTRDAGDAEGSLPELLDFERLGQMRQEWEFGRSLPKMRKVFRLPNEGYLYWSDEGLWTSGNLLETPDLEIRQLHPELAQLDNLVSVSPGRFLFMAGHQVYFLDAGLTARSILDLRTTSASSWVEYDPTTESVLIFNNRTMLFYRLSDLLAGGQQPMRRIVVDVLPGTEVFDYAVDRHGGNAVLRVNEGGKMKLVSIDLADGTVFGQFERMASQEQVKYLNNQFVFCGYDTLGSEIIMISPDAPGEARRIRVPWTGASVCARPAGGYYLVSDETALRTLDAGGLVSAPLGVNLDACWGEEDLRVSVAGSTLMVSSVHSLEVFADEDGAAVWARRSRRITGMVRMADGRLLFSSGSGWEIRGPSGKDVEMQGSETYVLPSSSEGGLLAWSPVSARVVFSGGDAEGVDLGGRTPVFYSQSFGAVAVEEDDETRLYRITRDEGLVNSVVLSRRPAAVLVELDHEVLAVSISEDRRALEFRSWDFRREEPLPLIRRVVSLGGSSTPVLSSDRSCLYWRDAEGMVNLMKLPDESVGLEDAEIRRILVSNADDDMLPIDSSRFALLESSGRLRLFKDGIKIRTFLPSIESHPESILSLGDDGYLILTASGSVKNIALPYTGVDESFGNDWARLHGPRFEAVRSASQIDLRWHDSGRTLLVGPGVGVDGFLEPAQSPNQVHVAAVDDEGMQILLWTPKSIDSRIQPVALAWDDSFGRLWFPDDETLVVGVEDAALVFDVSAGQLELVRSVNLGDLGTPEAFTVMDGRMYFADRGDRRFVSVDMRGRGLTSHFAAGPVYGLSGTPDGLLVGMNGKADLVDVNTGETIRRYQVPSNTWQVRTLVADRERGLLLLQTDALTAFDLDTGELIGTMEMPETLQAIRQDAEDTGRLYLSGYHFAWTVDLLPPLSNLDAFRASLPYEISGTELTYRHNPVAPGESN